MSRHSFHDRTLQMTCEFVRWVREDSHGKTWCEVKDLHEKNGPNWIMAIDTMAGADFLKGIKPGDWFLGDGYLRLFNLGKKPTEDYVAVFFELNDYLILPGRYQGTAIENTCEFFGYVGTFKTGEVCQTKGGRTGILVYEKNPQDGSRFQNWNIGAYGIVGAKLGSTYLNAGDGILVCCSANLYQKEEKNAAAPRGKVLVTTAGLRFRDMTIISRSKFAHKPKTELDEPKEATGLKVDDIFVTGIGTGKSFG